MFQFHNNKIVLDPNVLSLPCFKVIWEADTTKEKEEAIKLISYIFYLVDNKSPYMGYPEEKRRENIIKDYIRDSKFKESKILKEAIDKYREYNKTLSSSLLESVKHLLYKLEGYYKSIEFDPEGDPEFEQKKAEAAQKSVGSIGKTLDSLIQLEERVKKEVTQKSSVRGNAQMGQFSD